MEQIVVNGLYLGASYALIALGLTLIFALMNVLNFAHGQMYVLGGFITYTVVAQLGLPFVIGLLVTNHLGKKAPPGTIAREVVQTEVARHRLQPSRHCRTTLQFAKPFIRAQKNFLGDVFSFGLVGGQTHGGTEYHVLVVMQECLELLRIGHWLVPLVRHAC